MNDSVDWPKLLETVHILAVEESPLWEVLQDVKTLLPEAEEINQVAIATRAVGQLLERGIIDLVWRWSTDGTTSWKVAVPSEHGDILKDRKNWQIAASGNGPHIEIHLQ